jgi:opacity protein-like surface antigen
MKKLIFIFCLLALVSAIQAQTTGELSKNDFFAGFSYNSADINTLTINPQRTGQNGVNLAYTRYFNKNFGATADISAHFSRRTQTLNGGEFKSKRDQYFALGGVQFRAVNKSRLTPFARVMVGGSFFRGFTSNITPAGNFYTFDDATSFALALGGGLDVRVNKRIKVRLIQADYAPTFFGSGRQDNFRLSFGIVF